MSRSSASVSRRVWRKTPSDQILPMIKSFSKIISNDMSENFGTPYSEYPNVANNGINYDWAVPGYPQPSPFEFNPETIPLHDNRDNRDIRDYPSSDRVNAKVAIPRNAQPSSWTSSGRVSRACENCREQKAKCSGHRPTCHRCLDAGVPCSYGDRKREKMVKLVTFFA